MTDKLPTEEDEKRESGPIPKLIELDAFGLYILQPKSALRARFEQSIVDRERLRIIQQEPWRSFWFDHSKTAKMEEKGECIAVQTTTTDVSQS